MNNNEPIIGTFSLGEFNPKKEELINKAKEYEDLSISGIDDKKGYEIVHKAKMDIVRTRTDIQKKGKELRDPHTQFNKKVKELEDELISLIDPIEKDLKEKLEEIDSQKERIKQEQEQKKREALQTKVNKLNSIGYTEYNVIALQEMTNEEFDRLYTIKRQNFLILEEERKILQESINNINSCKTLEELTRFGVPENSQILEVYNKKYKELEFEEEQRKFREEQEKQRKIDEEKNATRNRILQINNIIDLHKYKSEIDSIEFETDFNFREQQIKLEEEQRVFKEEQEKQRIKQEEEEQEKQRKIEEEQRKKQEEEEQKRKAELQAKKQDYIKWRSELGYTEEEKDLYEQRPVNGGQQYELWKKLGTFNF